MMGAGIEQAGGFTEDRAGGHDRGQNLNNLKLLIIIVKQFKLEKKLSKDKKGLTREEKVM